MVCKGLIVIYGDKFGGNEMSSKNLTQGINIKSNMIQEADLLTYVGAFLLDRKVSNVAPGTLTFYQKKMRLFTEYCEAQLITRVIDISPDFIRRYLL